MLCGMRISRSTANLLAKKEAYVDITLITANEVQSKHVCFKSPTQLKMTMLLSTTPTAPSAST